MRAHIRGEEILSIGIERDDCSGRLNSTQEYAGGADVIYVRAVLIRNIEGSVCQECDPFLI